MRSPKPIVKDQDLTRNQNMNRDRFLSPNQSWGQVQPLEQGESLDQGQAMSRDHILGQDRILCQDPIPNQQPYVNQNLSLNQIVLLKQDRNAAQNQSVPHYQTMHLKRSGKTLSLDRLISLVLAVFAGISVLTTIGIVMILLTESIGFFRVVPFLDFLTGTKWTPLFSESQQSFGILPLAAGTMMITVIALLIALPIGLFSGIYLSEYAPGKVRAVLKPVLEILAGIPTIVYGFFALTFVTPLLQKIFPDMGMFNALSAGIVVGIMIIPMISSLSEDAMSAVPQSVRDASYALGATKLETALKIVVPAAFSGIVASFVLGFSRAIGETMIVAMASGGLANLTWNPLESMQTMTAYIVMVANGDTSHGSVEYNTIYAVGLALFVMTLLVNMLAGYLRTRFSKYHR